METGRGGGGPGAARPQAGTAAGSRLDLMLVAAAREIQDGELVLALPGLPFLAFQLARLTHAPRAIGLHDLGVVREHPARAPLRSPGDPPNLRGATMLADLQAVMSLLHQGRVEIGFVVAGEVDRFGNVGAGGAEEEPAGLLTPTASPVDICCLAGRTIVLARHERARFPERVEAIHGPGHGEGRGWRERTGLRSGGPAAIVTDLCVIRFGEDGEATVASLHAGVTLDMVRAATGWAVRAADPLPETAPPSAYERNRLDEIAPDGVWAGSGAAAGGG